MGLPGTAVAPAPGGQRLLGAESFADWVRVRCKRVQVIARFAASATLPNRKAPGQANFVCLPRRRVVERTFAWLGRWRRTSKDDEQNPRSSETWLYLTMPALMLHRLA